METPKFTPVAPVPPPSVVAADTAELDAAVRHTEMLASLDRSIQRIDELHQELAQAKAILKDVVAAGVLTDGFVTNAVAQSLIAQAAVAKKFLEEHP